MDARELLDLIMLRPIYPTRDNPGIVALGEGWHARPVRYVQAFGRVLTADRPPRDYLAAPIAACDIYVAHGPIWCSPLFYARRVYDAQIDYPGDGARYAESELSGRPLQTHVHIVHPATVEHPLPEYGDLIDLCGWICHPVPPLGSGDDLSNWCETSSPFFGRDSCPFFLPEQYVCAATSAPPDNRL